MITETFASFGDLNGCMHYVGAFFFIYFEWLCFVLLDDVIIGYRVM